MEVVNSFGIRKQIMTTFDNKMCGCKVTKRKLTFIICILLGWSNVDEKMFFLLSSG